VESGVVGDLARVARGTCRGVGGQHSWVVVDGDVYAKNARIVDPTLWSYRPDVKGIWYGSARDGWHVPHQAGSIWNYGRPDPNLVGPPIELAVDPGDQARGFLELLGPLDRRGWGVLLRSPMEGWPAAEIVDAADRTPALAALVPIDVLRHLTGHE
jgi:hypothetical protein